jgi:hypothetical protein
VVYRKLGRGLPCDGCIHLVYGHLERGWEKAIEDQAAHTFARERTIGSYVSHMQYEVAGSVTLINLTYQPHSLRSILLTSIDLTHSCTII